MFSIIDRYVARLFVGYYLGGLVVFVTLFLVIDYLTLSMQVSDVSTRTLIGYYASYAPEVIYQLTPVACLIGTVFTLSTLNRASELVALFSLGMSLARVAAPILALVALISVASFWVGDRVLPSLAQKKSYIYYVEIKKTPGLYSTVTTNKIWFRSENILFNIKTLNAESGTAEGLTLYYFDNNWQLVQLITAGQVSMRGRTWDLKNGSVTLFAEESSFPLTKTFKEKTLPMNEDIADIKAVPNSSDVLSRKELARFIAKNKEAGLDTLRYEVDYQAKTGFAFAAFVISTVGIPFSVSRQRSGRVFVNGLICVGLAFLYWALYSSAITLGYHGALPPLVAAWGPNLLVLGISAALLLRLRK